MDKNGSSRERQKDDDAKEIDQDDESQKREGEEDEDDIESPAFGAQLNHIDYRANHKENNTLVWR